MTISGAVTRSLLCSPPARSVHLSGVLNALAGLKSAVGLKISILRRQRHPRRTNATNAPRQIPPVMTLILVSSVWVEGDSDTENSARVGPKGLVIAAEWIGRFGIRHAFEMRRPEVAATIVHHLRPKRTNCSIAVVWRLAPRVFRFHRGAKTERGRCWALDVLLF